MTPIYLLYCLSGFVSLGYQVAWFRIYVDRFGSTNLTFALVLCNFIGGLGVGALVSRRFTERLSGLLKTRDRLRLYGAVELLVAASVLLTIASAWIPADTWGAFPYRWQAGPAELAGGGVFEQTLLYQLSKVAIAALCVFLPCFFMGVTFPLLCDAFRRGRGVADAAAQRFPAALYAWNTLGACAGVLVCQFALLRWLGHDRTLWLMAGLNAIIGVFFLRHGGHGFGAAAAAENTEHRSTPASGSVALGTTPAASANVGVLLACAILSGFLAGALEGDLFKRIWFLGGTRSAAMAFISFWAILAIFLGSWTVRIAPALRLNHIKLAFITALVFYATAWHHAYGLRNLITGGALASAVEAMPDAALATADTIVPFGPGLAHFLLFTGVFVFPAFFGLSLLLPYVCNRVHGDDRHLGLAYGLNTLSFCVGMVVFTHVAPRVNQFYSMKLLMVLLGIGVVFLALIHEQRRLAWWKPAAALAAALAGALLVPADFDRRFFVPHSKPAVHPVRALKSNGAHTTYIVSAPAGDRLYFDGHAMSGTSFASQVYMRLMAHFPLLAQEDPHEALLIGFGVGNTGSAIAAHQTIRRIDVVDLNRKVIETAPQFERTNGNVHLDPRVRFIHDDGRNFLTVTDRAYDLITSEPPPPMMAGVDRLYTREYYRQVLAHLKPDGMMTQWLPVYQMPTEAVDAVVATFVEAFADTLLITGFNREFILVGSRGSIDLACLERRFNEQPLVLEDLGKLNIPRPISLMARIVQGDASLRRRYDGVRILSDQRNDLAHLFVDPSRPAVIAYDPVEVLVDIDATRLNSHQGLRSILLHLGRLHYHVPDFPADTAMTVASSGSGSGALAKLDWGRINALMSKFDEARRAGRSDEALALPRAALELSFDQPRVLYELAHAHLSRGRFAEALPLLEMFIMHESDEAAGHAAMGMALSGMGRRQHAMKALRRALEIAPQHAEAHNILGTMLAGDGDLDVAIEHFEAAVRAKPDLAVARYNLGSALQTRDRTDEAQAQYRQALALAVKGGDHRMATALRGRLGRVTARVVGQ